MPKAWLRLALEHSEGMTLPVTLNPVAGGMKSLNSMLVKIRCLNYEQPHQIPRFGKGEPLQLIQTHFVLL